MATGKKPQAENRIKRQKFCSATLLLGTAAVMGVVPAMAQTTSSPLEILQNAPKVHLKDEAPATPRPPSDYRPAPQPAPYTPATNRAPAIEPVQPAFTPYSGASTRSSQETPRYQNPPAYQPPAQSPYGSSFRPAGTPTPTPRPVLGPEDVEAKKPKKKGIVRGLINAIPFVGGHDDDEKAAEPTPTPTPRPRYDAPYTGSRSAPEYRGYDAPDPGSARSGANHDEPLLLAPDSTPLSSDSPAPPGGYQDTAPGSDIAPPPILTPEPRVPPPIEPSVDLDNHAEVIPPGEATVPLVAPDAPVLTVKRDDDSATTATKPSASPTPASYSPEVITPDDKKPSRAVETATPTPRPLEKATTGVLIQESRPVTSLEEDSSLGPRPDPSATVVEAFDPTATPDVTPAIPAPTPAADDEITSLSIKQADLGMPNPAYEQNTSILAEFQTAVRLAREDRFAEAATAFREYAANHPSSGLAPRASFLSVIFEKSRQQARKNLDALETAFPKSRYLNEAKERRGDEIAKASTTAAATVVSPTDADVTVTTGASPTAATGPVVTTETPQQQIARLEKELTAAVGNPATEPMLRKQLGSLYLQQEEFDRAYEILRPAAEMAQDQPVHGDIMLALGRTMVARGETVQAISIYQGIEEKHPGLIESDAGNAWAVGLAYEGAGNYARARNLYTLVRQKYPASKEAGWATARLNDLAALRQ